VPIAYGETVAGDLAQRSKVDAYTFTGTAADLLVARLAETTSVLEPELRLYDASGAPVAAAATSSLAELPLTELPGSGTYSLLVMDDPGLDTGSYSLHVQRLNGPADATALSYGTTLSGTVPAAAATVAYTLDASLTDRVLLRAAEAATGSSLAPRLRLYGSDGTLLGSTYGSYAAELDALELPATATYTLLVLDNSGSYGGDFFLHCQRTNGPAGAVPLDYGDSHAATLDMRSEADAYTFTAAVNDTLVARMTEGTSALEPLLRLYGPGGDMVAGDAGSLEALITGLRLSEAGVYTLLAMDDPGLDTGDYLLHLQGGAGVSAVETPEAGELPGLSLALYGCSPNPFNPATTIRFELPATAVVKVEVYAVSGHRVATLVRGTMPAGRHAVTWRGCDDTGRELATGIYLVRMEAAGRRMTAKATLLK
jgi:hypothetical protein